MLLIDAVYINDGGGKVLLDYLIQELEKIDVSVFYLFDVRISNKHPQIKQSNKVHFLEGSLYKRHLFYKNNSSRFSKVLCFGNIPPSLGLKCEVYTYFHNLIYIKVPQEFSFFQRFKFLIKIQVLKYFLGNTTFWLVQSDLIKFKFQKKFNVLPQQVKVLPFYPQFEKNKLDIIREKNTYIYVSNGTPHKNQNRLIDVFCMFYDIHKKGKLILTVGNDSIELLNLISEKAKEGYPIENIGFVDRDTLQKTYLAAEFLIFPSLTESFGLGLIEAIECGCKVIGADLPYTYEVCEPSLVFNPLSKESMLEAFEKSILEDTNDSVPKIKTNITELIQLLNNV